MEAHGVQKRESGAPYFYHPTDVARFLAELKFDAHTVVAGLLHDVLEDANVSLEELENIFGTDVAFLVDGVTKLSKISYSSNSVRRAENFRKFIVATSRDVRTLAIKLADRLSNMRTLNYISSNEKRNRISQETLEIYAPLAERIGMNLVKDEMEDVAFYNLYPQEYGEISSKLDQIRKTEPNFIEKTSLELKRVFRRAGIEAEIHGREKRVYSIWKKIQKHNVSIEQINDIVAFRIIVDEIPQCYSSLGLIHTCYPIVPGRFKDYISIPKLNNYRSLHTTVLGPFKQPIEIQIRTKEMDRIANEGAAIHWAYKSDKISAASEDSKKYGWIRNLLTIYQNSVSSREAMANSKLEMFDSEVFCYTPKGDLVTLPRGATAVDFAYEIHSSIGNSCVAVKINGQVSPLGTVLKNGDRVDIITSPNKKPEAVWSQFAVTGKAKACIKKFIKEQEKRQFEILGEQLTKYVFASSGATFDESLIDHKKFASSSLNKFYCNVGKGIIPLGSVFKIIPNPVEREVPFENYVCLADLIPGIAVHFAECCRPILGDQVIGALIPRKGLEVHAESCDYLKKNKGLLIKTKWSREDKSDSPLLSKLRIIVSNQMESFSNVANIINTCKAVIINLKTERRTVGFLTLLVNLKTRNEAHLEEVLASLRLCSNVRSAEKID
jgi:GTP pyrophosphokinase